MYTEELYRKDLHDPDNHDGVITHLEPDILECEAKWALESITINKASGGDGLPVELISITAPKRVINKLFFFLISVFCCYWCFCLVMSDSLQLHGL